MKKAQSKPFIPVSDTPVPWYSITGNPFLVEIDPLMLNDDGYTIIRAITNKDKTKENRLVRYDEIYLYEMLDAKFFGPLKELPSDVLRSILETALEYHLFGMSLKLPDNLSSSAKREIIRYQWNQAKQLESDSEQTQV